MAAFLVETYASQSAFRESERRARSAADELARRGIGIRYIRCLFMPEDQLCFHLFEAADLDATREASRIAGLTALRVMEVQT